MGLITEHTPQPTVWQELSRPHTDDELAAIAALLEEVDAYTQRVTAHRVRDEQRRLAGAAAQAAEARDAAFDAREQARLLETLTIMTAPLSERMVPPLVQVRRVLEENRTRPRPRDDAALFCEACGCGDRWSPNSRDARLHSHQSESAEVQWCRRRLALWHGLHGVTLPRSVLTAEGCEDTREGQEACRQKLGDALRAQDEEMVRQYQANR
jgi:hypothetical protein